MDTGTAGAGTTHCSCTTQRSPVHGPLCGPRAHVQHDPSAHRLSNETRLRGAVGGMGSLYRVSYLSGPQGKGGWDVLLVFLILHFKCEIRRTYKLSIFSFF